MRRLAFLITVASLPAACVSRAGFERLPDDPEDGNRPSDPGPTYVPTFNWNTFLGGDGTDYGNAVTVDRDGDVYIGGMSNRSWGTPVSEFHPGNWDAFIAMLDTHGDLVWNTFLGALDWRADSVLDVAVDIDGNVYAAGSSQATWGTPLRKFSGGSHDAFLAKLDHEGNLLWHIFAGGIGTDAGEGVAIDGAHLYLGGSSDVAWGAPLTVRAHSGSTDAYVAEFDTEGTLIWNTFLGGEQADHFGNGLAVDADGDVFVPGVSTESWGAPIRAFTESTQDAFVGKLAANGSLVWHTFVGSTGAEEGRDITLDRHGNVFLSGVSDATWGSPVREFSGGSADTLLVKLDNDGNPLWHTFLGGGGRDVGDSIAVSSEGDVFLSGFSGTTWGDPSRSFSGGATDAFAARVDSDGVLLWNTFLGGNGGEDTVDFGNTLALDGVGNVYVAGDSDTTWESPRREFTTGTHDVFATKISDRW